MTSNNTSITSLATELSTGYNSRDQKTSIGSRQEVANEKSQSSWFPGDRIKGILSRTYSFFAYFGSSASTIFSNAEQDSGIRKTYVYRNNDQSKSLRFRFVSYWFGTERNQSNSQKSSSDRTSDHGVETFIRKCGNVSDDEDDEDDE
ncbi:MAG: hypothetical protein ACOYK6_00315 [Chthoniobacterales bacterium]